MLNTIDHDLLSLVSGGTGAVDQSLAALQSKYGGGGWVSLDGTPKVTRGRSADTVRGAFTTEPWEPGNQAIDRSFTGSVPHHGTWDQVGLSNVHVLPRGR